MAAITFREATLEDKPKLLQFEQQLIAYERPFDSVLKENCTYYDLDYLIQSNDTKLIVATTNNHLIACGYAKVVKAKPYHNIDTYTYMGFMYVDPKFRGQGIIQDIIEQLKQWSISLNIFETRLEVYSDNESAIKAYQKKGFKNRMIEMKMILK
ncbi:GNAT family N-acetyltransferase [Olleya sp. YSTF-M6]|uniref:GNAT family N-acetyltransferase n=1 Tax=Olleya sediminilitoris TaxID=2795739 RepID=A0ABS1WMS1_9FLAO|nr:GNAT family N-acetyltransferase [Olleya sediminilitoris]MBL7560416.1 GNAT family N-acetyltransferase [Olleya sediminilitoris]